MTDTRETASKLAYKIANWSHESKVDAIDEALRSERDRKSESAWLLEKMHEGQLWYIQADHLLQWTNDPLKALRLARREDAEALSTIVDDCDKIAEHEWVPPAIRNPKGD